MRSILVVLGMLSALPALAQEPSHHRHAQAPAHSPLDCWCRAQGRIFAPGETICLRTGDVTRVAECRMEINVMSWGITDQPCPQS